MEVVLSAAKYVVFESIGLASARNTGQCASWTKDAEGNAIPEVKLNSTLLGEAFLQLLASGLGALALLWATVVLLGGFSTMLVRTDFWFTTAIVFIETARIVGYISGPEARFFVDFLSGLPGVARGFGGKLSRQSALITLAPVVAAAGCITLSIMRIVPIARHDRYDDSSSDSSKGNIKPALLLFYALVLTQGSLFIFWFKVAMDRSLLSEQLSWQYFGNMKEGRKLIDRYVTSTVDKCMEKGVVSTMHRTLVSFAEELLQSEVSSDHVCAVSLLHAVITRKERTAGAVQQLCASEKSVGRLFEILSSEESIYEQQSIDNRKPLMAHGLLILAKLAKNPENAKEIYNNKGLFSMITAPISNELYKVLKHDETAIEITGKSLLVLSKLVRPDVRQEICNSGFGPDTIKPILLTDDSRYNKLKVQAIKMLTKLILTASSSDRDDSTIVHFIHVLMDLFFKDANQVQANTPDINQVQANTPDANQVQANIPDANQVQANTPDANQELANTRDILRKTAGKALALLPMDRNIFCEMVVKGNAGTKHSVPQELANMLSDSSNKLYRTSIAKLLTQICANLRSEEARQHLEAVKTTILHEVLKTICNVKPGTRKNQWDWNERNPIGWQVLKTICNVIPGTRKNQWDWNERNSGLIELGKRKTLVAFLGLAIQMCECDELLDADDFDAAVKQIFRSNEAEGVVDKLKEVIEMCNKESVALLKGKGPCADYLEIIKSVTKLCKWVMRTKPDYRGYFQEKKIAQKLKDALEAMRGLEMTLLLSCSAKEIANYKTLESIVNDAQELIGPITV